MDNPAINRFQVDMNRPPLALPGERIAYVHVAGHYDEAPPAGIPRRADWPHGRHVQSSPRGPSAVRNDRAEAAAARSAVVDGEPG